MITSKSNAPWPLDCPLTDLTAAGLPAPSKVRCKLLALDRRLVRGPLGRLSPEDADAVREGLARWLGGNPVTTEPTGA